MCSGWVMVLIFRHDWLSFMGTRIVYHWAYLMMVGSTLYDECYPSKIAEIQTMQPCWHKHLGLKTQMIMTNLNPNLDSTGGKKFNQGHSVATLGKKLWLLGLIRMAIMKLIIFLWVHVVGMHVGVCPYIYPPIWQCVRMHSHAFPSSI